MDSPVETKPPEQVVTPEKAPKPLHPALVANIWKPGQSGNPSGRPKGIIRDQLYDALRAGDDKRLKGIVLGIVRSAKKGNPKAFAVIRDSIDGRPVTPVDLNVQGLQGLVEALAKAKDRAKGK
jgi:hypothetical protein